MVKWFKQGSYDLSKVGTKEEVEDQKRWRLRVRAEGGMVDSASQLFFVDETGCNRHTLRRTHGYSKKGTTCRAKQGSFGTDKGVNNSVIIALSRSSVLAHEILVGDVKSTSKRKRGTKRVDFCHFLKTKVAQAMLDSADASGVDPLAPLFLIMDNASNHKGAVVSDALRSVSHRLHVAYQPPYMPTVHPTELVNHQLKSKLKAAAIDALVADICLPQHSMQSGGVNDHLGGVSTYKSTLNLPVDLRANLSSFQSLNCADSSRVLKQLISHILQNEIHSTSAYYKHCGWH